MAKIVNTPRIKEPSFMITIIVVLLVFIALFIFRTIYQIKTHPPAPLGYEYGTLTPKKSGLTDAATFVALGQEALDENRFEDARTIFKYGTEHYPVSAKLWMGLSESYLKEGYKEQAILPLEEAAKVDSQNAYLWYRLAELYYLTGAFEKSELAIKKAVDLKPKKKSYQIMLAQIYNLKGDYSKSRKIYGNLLAKDPQNSDLSFAYLKINAWVNEQPTQDHATITLNEAKKDLQSGKGHNFHYILDEYRILFGETPAYQTLLAEAIYQSYLKNHPKSADVWYQLAQFYSDANRPHEAWNAVEEAIKIVPLNIDFLKLRLELADELDKTEEKISTLESILAIYPESKEFQAQLDKIRIDLFLEKIGDDISMNPDLLKANPQLLHAVINIEERNFLAAFELLNEYAQTELVGDPLFQSVLAMMISRMDKCAIASLCTEQNFIKLTKILIETGEEFRDNSYTFQWVAQQAASQALCIDPCNIDNLNLYADAVRLLEQPPTTEYILAQRAYGQILEIDPCNDKALRNLARVTALNREIDSASDMYESYVRRVGLGGLDAETTIEYSDVLEDQGNNSLALKYLKFFPSCFTPDQNYCETLAHQLNSADRPSSAYPIALRLLEKDNCSYEGWLNFTRAAAGLGYPYASLYGLYQMEKLEPTNSLTTEAQWMTLIPLLSNINFGGLFHQERGTTLSQWSQYLSVAYTLWPGVQATAGISGFETHADTTTAILGLGDLRQVNGKTWAGECSAWIGFNKFFTRQFQGNFRLGLGYTNAASSLCTPEYGADLSFPLCDNLSVDLFSSYGFYNYSPRDLSLFIRRWHNELVVDWYSNFNTHLLSNWEINLLTDGNQLYEITLSPRHAIHYSQYWKIEVGAMFNWLHARKEVQNGYYSPHLYQGYGAECLIDYVINDFSVIKLNETIGGQKDTFNSQFGLLWDNKLEVLYNFSLYWYLEFNAEYYYEGTTQGVFDYIEFSGKLTHRF